MPELPEVEHGRRLAETALVGQTLKRVRTAQDRIVLTGHAPSTIARKLRGRKVRAVHRRGKYLWFELDQKPHPIFHFAMTGAFKVPGIIPVKLRMGPSILYDQRGDWPPRFTKIHFHASNGNELVMTNVRRWGRIWLSPDPLQDPRIQKLGFDPLLDLPKLPEFTQQLTRRKVAVKAILLDQSFAAGVGNWIADEILYQAHINPTRKTADLTPDEIRTIRLKMRAIIRKAVEVNAIKERYPRTWLFHHRWGKKENACTRKGEKIAFTTVATRTTAWVPSVQL